MTHAPLISGTTARSMIHWPKRRLKGTRPDAPLNHAPRVCLQQYRHRASTLSGDVVIITLSEHPHHLVQECPAMRQGFKGLISGIRVDIVSVQMLRRDDSPAVHDQFSLLVLFTSTAARAAPYRCFR